MDFYKQTDNKLFDLNSPKLVEWLTIYSKSLFNTIKRTFNFPIGKKININISKNIIRNKDCKLSLIQMGYRVTKE